VSDAELRALEKKARAGDADAGQRWLVARLRAGTISPERVAIAAYVGDEGARRAISAERPICECNMIGKKHGRECPLAGKLVAETPNALRIPKATWKWLTHFPTDRELLARVALAVFLEGDAPPADPPASVVALAEAVRSWLDCPCEKHAMTVRARHRERLTKLMPRGAYMNMSNWLRATSRWDVAAQAAVGADPAGVLALVDELAQARARRRQTTEERVRSAVREAILPWAVGEATAAPRRKSSNEHVIQNGADVKLVRDRLAIPHGRFVLALKLDDRRFARIERQGEALTDELATRADRFLESVGLLARARRLLKRP